VAFTVSDFEDLLRLLDDRPEWRAELRRRLLGDELLELPALVRQIAEQLAGLTTRVDQLAEHLDTLISRLDMLTARVDQIAEQLATLTARVDTLTDRVDQLTARMEQQVALLEQQGTRLDQQTALLHHQGTRLDQLTDVVGELRGTALEQDYRTKAPAYFGQVMRGLRVIDSARLADLLDEALDRGAITDAERLDALRTDIVLSGRRRDTGAEVYLAVDASAGIRPDDVQRAIERARVLAKLGRPAYPVVAGQEMTRDAAPLAAAGGVWQLHDGRAIIPPAS
jgi:uncharacterized protein YoxC